MTFSYYISFGKLDSADCELEMELEDEEVARLVEAYRKDSSRSFKDIPELEDIYDEVYCAAVEQEKDVLMGDRRLARDLLDGYFDGDEDFDTDGPVTEEMIDAYLKELGITVSFPNEIDEISVCANCGAVLEEDDEQYTLEDGSVVCEDCYDEMFAACDLCGERVPVEELSYWGDCRICEACMEEQNPSFDEEENEEETAEAYEAMRQRWIGKHTEGLRVGENALSYTCSVRETDVSYALAVTVNDEGVITDISRLTAQMLMSEALTSSDWRPYAVDEYDYEDVVEEMLEKYVPDEGEEE